MITLKNTKTQFSLKLFSYVLPCLMLLSIMTSCSRKKELSMYNWVYEGKNAVVSSYKGEEYKLKIPSKVSSHPVVAIGEEAFKEVSCIETVIIPSSVKEIRWEAFGECKFLTKVYIPGSVKVIGGYAFSQCDSLTDVIIKRGVERIEVRAFAECRSLKSIRIPKTVKVIDRNAFENCKSLTEVIFEGKIEDMEINSSAFYGCSSLKNNPLEK